MEKRTGLPAISTPEGLRRYSVSFGFFDTYNPKRPGLASCCIIVDAKNKFEAMAAAWSLIQCAVPASVEEPKTMSAETVGGGCEG